MTQEKMHILVVDDEEGMRDLLEENLMEHGYVCHAVGSGQRALEILAAERVDLALIDIIMPGMTGLTLCDQLNKRYPEIPVVFLSAIDDLRIAGERMYTRADDYLVKPVSRKMLHRVIAEGLERRRTSQEEMLCRLVDGP